MPRLTPDFICAQETETAEHFAELAQKARKAGDRLTADEHQYVADLAIKQAAKADQAMQI